METVAAFPVKFASNGTVGFKTVRMQMCFCCFLSICNHGIDEEHAAVGDPGNQGTTPSGPVK